MPKAPVLTLTMSAPVLDFSLLPFHFSLKEGIFHRYLGWWPSKLQAMTMNYKDIQPQNCKASGRKRTTHINKHSHSHSKLTPGPCVVFRMIPLRLPLSVRFSTFISIPHSSHHICQATAWRASSLVNASPIVGGLTKHRAASRPTAWELWSPSKGPPSMPQLFSSLVDGGFQWN